MNRLLRALLLVILVHPPLPAQPSGREPAEERRSKLEIILRSQDTRTIHDGTLIHLLSDRDETVRKAAVHAFGSIQDTSVIHLLVDRLANDESRAVQTEAAFAIGQTAGQLSQPARQTLGHDLIWTRLDKIDSAPGDSASPADRLIEEIGKFGPDESLADLVRRFATLYPPVHANALVRSVARFAIRGITNDEAVQYLLKMISPPDSARWQVVYALQRIGDHPRIRADLEEIVKLRTNNDPLVRMNCAVLLGKARDEKVSLSPLQKLAEFDPDWHVRVNALIALGKFNLKGKDDLIGTFGRLFLDENRYVALTALSAFGGTGLQKDSGSGSAAAFAVLERIAVNDGRGHLWQLQAAAATALAKLEGAGALPDIVRAERGERLLEGDLLLAAANTGAPDAEKLLSPRLAGDDTYLYRSALEGYQILGGKNPGDPELTRRTCEAAVAALSARDVAVVTTAASILGDSLFRRSSSVEPLVNAMGRLRVPDDVEALQEIAATLGKLNDKRAVDPLKRLLSRPDRSVALAAAAALKAITGTAYAGDIPEFLEPLYTDFDFDYLYGLPETIRVRIQTIRGDITLALYRDAAPFTVMSFLKLASKRAFYRGLTFHRVVPNFVIQGGDPRGDGWGGPGYSIRSEFSALTYETGSIGIASAGRDTEGSQFFITQSPQPHLDGRYTLFGRVISGMEVVDRILVDDHIIDVSVVRE
jgi:peptidylprolyl isomerase